MLVNVYRARANDLHKTSECVDDRCEHVVFYNEHVAALNELSSKLDAALAELRQWAGAYDGNEGWPRETTRELLDGAVERQEHLK